ncbi:MAG: presenilin family intramembrane aspartyl protease [Candidatus Micrarchaeota archaeon]
MREVASVIGMFLIVQLLGLYVGAVMIDNVSEPEFAEMNVAPMKESGDPLNSLYFIFIVIMGAAFLIFLIRVYRGVFLFKLLEATIIFVASNIVLFAIFYSIDLPFYDLWAFLGAISLAILKFYRPRLKNLAAVISSAGVGAIFGFSLNIIPAMLFIICLSLYDFFAVFYTKHMVTMARELGKRNLSFSVSVESTRKRRAKPSEIKAAEKRHEKPKKFIEERMHLELGTGDMAIPLMLSVSAYRFGGLWYSSAVCIGACVGLYFVLDYVFKRKSFLPALPPISFGALIMLGFAWMISNLFSL